eukprot:TRINITY_DN108667_c0_g1_i1.p1 TRINITY_DN108667_c0_g1~~TRINITY_DN108667_c0_g1_i1.p1  ORF type:complete len:303 (+),score=43.70 TRINITY_DN108667_c0_g1_i1:57-965(+)
MSSELCVPLARCLIVSYVFCLEVSLLAATSKSACVASEDMRCSTESGGPTCIILWAIMRAGSSATSRAFTQRSDTHALFKPFTKVYYLGTEREDLRDLDIPPDPQFSYDGVWSELYSPPGGEAVTFAKDFPVALPRRLWRSPEMARAKHAFLIRHPADAMLSVLKASTEDSENTGYTYFNETKMGYGEMELLFRLVMEEFGQEPVVIDHDDLMQDPEALLQELTRRLGIDFDPSMMHWTKPLPPHPDIWAGFFDVANRSKGFGLVRTRSPRGAVPQEISGAVGRALPIYEALRSHRLQTSIA